MFHLLPEVGKAVSVPFSAFLVGALYRLFKFNLFISSFFYAKSILLSLSAQGPL